MIGTIIPCPVEISETRYIRIVADATNAPTAQSLYKWDYKAIAHDPVKRRDYGLAFNVTKKEVETWQQ